MTDNAGARIPKEFFRNKEKDRCPVCDGTHAHVHGYDDHGEVPGWFDGRDWPGAAPVDRGRGESLGGGQPNSSKYSSSSSTPEIPNNSAQAQPPVDLEAIEARANEATPGPWNVSEAKPDVHVAKIAEFFVYKDWLRSSELGEAETDAAFIAHARKDIPDLIATVRALQSENARLQAEVKGMREAATDLMENGLRFDLNPTVPLDPVDDVHRAYLAYLQRMDKAAREIGAKIVGSAAAVHHQGQAEAVRGLVGAAQAGLETLEALANTAPSAFSHGDWLNKSALFTALSALHAGDKL